MDIREHGAYTTIHRDDGKIVIIAKGTYDHIGLHASPGNGSVFSGGIKPSQVNNFIFDANIPDTGGPIPANFPGGGYLLVAPIDIAMQFEDAVVLPGEKQERGQPVAVAAVHTTQPISDFSTDEATVLVFPYDPGRSDDKTNEFVNSNPELSEALSGGKLYALATAFPGGFSIDSVGGIALPAKTDVPRTSEWGGFENPSWAVIIPDSTGNPILENWNRLAGLL